MRILVLGGTRFIGRTIVDTLLPEHEVSVLNRGTQPLWDERITQLTADRGVPAQVAAALTADYDAIVDVSAIDPDHVSAVIDALAGRPAVPYVFIGSSAVYDRSAVAPPFSEDDPADGDLYWGSYSTDKAACERLLRAAFGDLLTVLRPPYVYGPLNTEQREQFLWARMLAGQPIYVPGDGGTAIQFNHVRALADIVEAACTGAMPTGVYNVGEPRAYTFSEYLHILGQVAGVTPRVEFVRDETVPSRAYFPFRDIEVTLQVDRIERTGAQPAIALPAGLAETFRWFSEFRGFPDEPTEQELAWRKS